MGHQSRGEHNSMSTNIIPGERPRGRPGQRRRDRVDADVEIVDGTAKLETAIDRDKWRHSIEAAKDLNGPQK